MNSNTKIILSLVAAGVIAYFLYKRYISVEKVKSDVEDTSKKTKEDLIKDCRENCDMWNETCTKGCENLSGNEKAICLTACKGSTFICNKTCTGKSGLRNGSLHNVNVYDKDKKHLTILTAWEPRKLELEPNQFPIYATRCLDINMKECPQNDTTFVKKIEKPGCYILWGGGSLEFYTTTGACVL